MREETETNPATTRKMIKKRESFEGEEEPLESSGNK